MNDEMHEKLIGPFPPFVPAKPKGGVAAEIIPQAQSDTAIGLVESTFAAKAKRKRRTAAEMEAARAEMPLRTDPAGVPLKDVFTVYREMVGLLAGIAPKTRLEILQMLMDYHT